MTSHSELKAKLILVGSPNSGKTTLFNRITGLRGKTVNYPGSTVEISLGEVVLSEKFQVEILDTPGIYGLVPRSNDEAVTAKVLEEAVREAPAKSRLLLVVDSLQLERQLELVLNIFRKIGSQISAQRIAVVLTMGDLLADECKSVDLRQLQLHLGVRVFGSSEEYLDQKLADWIDSSVSDLSNFRVPVDESFVEARKIANAVLKHDNSSESNSTCVVRASVFEVSRRWDRWALHPWFGPLIFLSLMSTLFISIYWVASPLMEAVDNLVNVFSNFISAQLPVGLLNQFVTDGVLAGVGSVLVFVPQIFILFVGIVLLEDSGYLARAAALVDRPLRKLGLGGRSFVPLLSGYACAVPAILAARSIPSKSERWTTIAILPLMSCSARLPVYALLLRLAFPDSSLRAGIALAGLYLASFVIGGVVSATIAKRIQNSHALETKRDFFALELPPYRKPSMRNIISQSYSRSKSYLQKAGGVILLLSVLIWTGTTFPEYQIEDKAERLEKSYFASLGKSLSPVFAPMGGDWRTGVSLLSAFAAREVFVSTMAVIFKTGVEKVEGDESTTKVIGVLENAKKASGEPLFTKASITSLLIYFLIALQCLSTFAVAAKETGKWSFAVMQLIAYNLLAYLLSVASYSILTKI